MATLIDVYRVAPPSGREEALRANSLRKVKGCPSV